VVAAHLERGLLDAIIMMDTAMKHNQMGHPVSANLTATEQQYFYGPPATDTSALDSPLGPLEYDATFAGKGILSFPLIDGKQPVWASAIIKLQGTDIRYLASFYETLSSANPDGYKNTAGLLCFDSHGFIDTSFGDKGISPVSFSKTDYTMPLQLIVLNSGDFLIAGYLTTFDAPYIYISMMLCKHKADGTLDTRFGDEGLINLTQATGMNLNPIGITELADGKIMIAASLAEEGPYRSYMIRLEAQGRFDASFGENGIKAFTKPNSNATGTKGIKPYEGGNKIIWYGNHYETGIYTASMARLDMDGNPDHDFGVDGFLDMPTGDSYNAIANLYISPEENSVLVLGEGYKSQISGMSAMLMRYLPDGDPDVTFNNGLPMYLKFHESAINNYWTVAGTPSDLTGKIIVSGNGSRGPNDSWSAVARFDADGKLDTTFAYGKGIGSPTNAHFFPNGGKYVYEQSRVLCCGTSLGTAAVIALKNGPPKASAN